MVAVALVDSLRGRGGDGDAGGDSTPALPVERLRAAGVAGTLVWADDGCRLHALRLPEGTPARAPSGPDVGCSFELSPDGTRVAPGGARWGTSAFYAVCRGTRVDVQMPPMLRPLLTYRGCAPAWRPTRDGPFVLTLVRDGELVEVQAACEGQPPCEERLLGRDAVREAAAASTASSEVVEADILDADWVTPERLRLRLLLRLPFGASRHVVATYHAGRLVSVEPRGRRPFRGRGALVRDGRVVAGGVELPIEARAAAFAPVGRDRRPVAQLEALGAFGTLVYATDAGCTLRAVRLPGLADVPPPSDADGIGCPFELSPDASGVSAPGSAWSPDGRLLAECVGGATRVTEVETGTEVYRVDGCAPSWRSPNALVVGDGQQVVQWLADCHRGRAACRRPLLGRAALVAAAARHVNAPDDRPSTTVRVVDTAWLGGGRLAVLLAASYAYPETTLGPYETVAVFMGDRLVGTFASLGPPLGGLEASPRAGVVLALPGTLLSARAEKVELPDDFGPVHAGALSPDGRLVALAVRGAVVVLPTDAPRPVLKLPIAAADVAWR